MLGIYLKKTVYIYNNATGLHRKIGYQESGNAQPPVEDVTPEWIYKLSRISNSPAVLLAIPLKRARTIEFTNGQERKITLNYPDDASVGDDSYTWNYVSECEIYLGEEGKGKNVYLLWYNTVDKQWYAAFTYSYNL